jgi:hypothetical protein
MFIKSVFAAETPLGKFEGLGPLGNLTGADPLDSAVSMFNKVISLLIGIITIGAGLWFTFHILIAGFTWLTAAGDKTKAEKAQKTLTEAVIGLVIVVAAVFIADLVGKFLGIDILSPGATFKTFWPK